MHTQQQLLEMALKRTGSNYTELGKQLGVTRQAMSQFKFGGPMSLEISRRLAKLVGMDAQYVAMCTEHNKHVRLAQTEGDEEKRLAHMSNAKVYEKIAKNLEEYTKQLERGGR